MSGEQEDRFDAIDDDADRGELRELLLDSVPGLDDGQRDAMFEHTFEAPVEDDHATDGLIPVDEVFGGTDEDWDASYGVDVADGSDIAGDAVEDVTAPEHDFTDHTDGLLDPHDTHETPDDLSDTHEFGMDHGAGHDQPIVGDLPDGDGDWA